MTATAVLFYMLAALGMVTIGLRYGRGDVPLDYHGEIIGQDGGERSEGLLHVLTALYRSMSGAFLGLAVLAMYVALTQVSQGSKLASVVLFAAFALAGWQAVVSGRRVEAATGVRTPWRVAAGLVGLAGVALVLSLI